MLQLLQATLQGRAAESWQHVKKRNLRTLQGDNALFSLTLGNVIIISTFLIARCANVSCGMHVLVISLQYVIFRTLK